MSGRVDQGAAERTHAGGARATSWLHTDANVGWKYPAFLAPNAATQFCPGAGAFALESRRSEPKRFCQLQVAGNEA